MAFADLMLQDDEWVKGDKDAGYRVSWNRAKLPFSWRSAPAGSTRRYAAALADALGITSVLGEDPKDGPYAPVKLNLNAVSAAVNEYRESRKPRAQPPQQQPERKPAFPYLLGEEGEREYEGLYKMLLDDAKREGREVFELPIEAIEQMTGHRVHGFRVSRDKYPGHFRDYDRGEFLLVDRDLSYRGKFHVLAHELEESGFLRKESDVQRNAAERIRRMRRKMAGTAYGRFLSDAESDAFRLMNEMMGDRI
ncbi:MAG: hypothetical protein HYW25_00605 [Candidatus Aenigmarchaeota archaeon]|nr:hypothetical protein [Candidatus Aenigmarchaeota archaeon]